MKLECIAVLLHTFISVITINVILKEKRQILQIAFYFYLYIVSSFKHFLISAVDWSRAISRPSVS